MTMDDEMNPEYEGAEIVKLTDEDGNTMDFELIGELTVDDQLYYALMPIESDDDEYVVLRVENAENGCENLVTIDDDEEFEKIAAAFEEKFMNEYDFDEDADGLDDIEEIDGVSDEPKDI